MAQAIAENSPLLLKPRSNGCYHRKIFHRLEPTTGHLHRHPLNKHYCKAIEDHISTYASALAGKLVRTLVTIGARFDLATIQYDVINTFVHTEIPCDVFMKMPDDYTKKGRVLRLWKALYGLKEPPLLWQKSLTATLKDFGCDPAPHEPCCWIRGGVIIFFYVDDIDIPFKRGSRQKGKALVASIKQGLVDALSLPLPLPGG